MRVAILMSTFNGAQFVGEQVASILLQLPADGILIVRDDGSTDDTVACIEAFDDLRIHITRGQNLGFAHSFLTLLARAPEDAEMVMFSDQDDVWLSGKIEKAWRQLLPYEGLPALYCSAQTLTDEALVPLEVTRRWPRGPSFHGALAENIVTGCTAALNRAATTLLKRAGVDPGIRFHDWWAYLVVTAFGKVVVDDEATLLYRQHGSNVIGHGIGWWGRQMQMLVFLRAHDWVGILLAQVLALRVHYWNELAPHRQQVLDRYFRVQDGRATARWRLVFSLCRWRQSSLQELMFRGLLSLHMLRVWPPPSRRL